MINWKRAILAPALLAFAFQVQAQFREYAMPSMQKLEKHASGNQKATPLSLPFWDDFSAHTGMPDTLLWEAAPQVNISGGSGYLPPTLNTVNFDALDAFGKSYVSDVNAVVLYGKADSLVSKPIDLSGYQASDLVKLSFFLQEKGFAQAPEDIDSLVLSFKNDQGEWVRQQSWVGQNLSQSPPFKQYSFSISDAAYLHKQFQFKFQLYCNLTGNFDTWHLDYVYLNEGREASENYYADRALTAPPSSPFKRYTQIPLTHLQSLTDLTPWLDSLEVNYYNLFNLPIGLDFIGYLSDPQGQVIDTVLNIGNPNTLPFSNLKVKAPPAKAAPLENFVQSATDSTGMVVTFHIGRIDTLLSEDINGSVIYYPQYDLRINDTVRTQIQLAHTYAYDDGSAESSVELTQSQGQVAQQFVLLKSGILTGVDIFAPNIAKNQSVPPIEIRVWKKLSGQPEDLLYTESFPLQLSDSMDVMKHYAFSQPLRVSDTIYIGYKQLDGDYVNIGFDKNTHSSDYLYYNVDGTWQMNDELKGSLMLRADFNPKEVPTGLPKVEDLGRKIYPNPFHDSFYLDTKFDQLQLYTLEGRQIQYTLTPYGEGWKVQPKGLKGTQLLLIRVIKGNAIQFGKLLFNP